MNYKEILEAFEEKDLRGNPENMHFLHKTLVWLRKSEYFDGFTFANDRMSAGDISIIFAEDFQAIIFNQLVEILNSINISIAYENGEMSNFSGDRDAMIAQFGIKVYSKPVNEDIGDDD